ncbi:MAG: hypothetical protein EOM90_01770 [Alphaproteobacteria bacterium]|nr:hypothetical protein [Alphaproteobacteria bacterium]
MAEYLLQSPNQQIFTDISGHLSLLGFYNYARTHKDCWVTLNFDGINFMDANLCSLLFAMIHHLKASRNVKTFIDFNSARVDLNIFSRNGFFSHVAGKQFTFKPFDNRDTTIPLSCFSQDDVDGFCNYIERDFLHQRGLESLTLQDKEKVKNSYFEIYDNVGLHANTNEPIFICGQYFPKQCELKFTLVDLGDGFLKKITEFTKNNGRITKGSAAIDWAIKGNSTKVGALGGTGLKRIFCYCYKSGGSMHIISDDCYYNLTNKNVTTHSVPYPFVGTTIHLIFHFLRNGN